MRRLSFVLSFVFALPAAAQPRPHNVLLFVADGLRPGMVNALTAPTMTALMAGGVRFANSHSLFPTFTTANAAALATGHYPGDHGDFSNVIFTGKPIDVPRTGPTVTPFLEYDRVLGDVDANFGGDYLDEETILRGAREKGFSTAAIGKLGPTLIQDHSARDGQTTLIVDDSTGHEGPDQKHPGAEDLGVPLSDAFKRRLAEKKLDVAPERANPGPNVEQQAYFIRVAVEVVLPWFKERDRTFAFVYWSRDPDGTQHGQMDSPEKLIPGINGPTSLAAIKNADDNLAALLAALKQLGLDGDTDVILTSDHGFSTISKESATSWAASQAYEKVPAGQLPPGFAALDLAHGLSLPLADPDKGGVPVKPGAFPSRGNGLLGLDPTDPEVVVAANGGSDLIYVPKVKTNRPAAIALARRIVELLSAQDYVSGVFVDDSLGDIPGALPLQAIGMKGAAVTPSPAIAVNFRSFSTGCDDPTTCGVEVADSGLRQGQGMHGSFSRADTRNIMAATGPSFKAGFVDRAPASNADIGMTIARLLDLQIAKKGDLVGRVLEEALPNGAEPLVASGTKASVPDSLGHATEVRFQQVGATLYYDAAGYPGRTLGLGGDAGSYPARALGLGDGAAK
jgi:arylsulfatase A-like enzyme